MKCYDAFTNRIDLFKLTWLFAFEWFIPYSLNIIMFKDFSLNFLLEKEIVKFVYEHFVVV
jgi:hypothetical protein